MAKKKNNNVAYIIGGVVIVILVLWIILANIGGNKVVCNLPYIQVGQSCCLDDNVNNVCDSDEEEIVIEPSCGDGICQSNENVPDCSDCQANIRIQNVKYEIIKESGRYDELAITSYDVIQLGDKVVVYPGLDVYTGYSDAQCSKKDLMLKLKDNFDCPGGCYYVIDGDKKGKSYEEDGTQLVRTDLFDTALCTYFVLELKPYPEEGIGRYTITPEPIETWESQIIMI